MVNDLGLIFLNSSLHSGARRQGDSAPQLPGDCCGAKAPCRRAPD